MATRLINKLNILTFGVKAVFIALFFLLAVGFFVVFNYSYEEFTLLVMQAYGKVQRLEIFRSRYLTEERYTIARIVLSVLLLLFSLILWRLKKFSDFICAHILLWIQSFHDFRKYLLECYVLMSVTERVIFWSTIIIISAAKWIFMHRYYFQNDELFSYLFFVRKGLLVLTSYYPGPNNHIFYSLLAYITQLFSFSPFYTMKLPSFIAGSLAPVFLFFFFKRAFKFSICIIGIILFSCSIHFFYYSLFGRGYVLMTFFSMFAFFMTLEIMNGRKGKFVWHIYVVASVFGFYTLPSYLYPFVSFAVAMGLIMVIRKRTEQIKPYLYYHTIITVLVLIAYSPVVLISGVASLTSNPWVVRLESQMFFSLFPGIIRNMFGYLTNMEEGAVWFSIVVLSFAGVIVRRTKNMHWTIMMFSVFVMPILMLLVQRVNPFDRVWTYLILPYSLCLIVIVDYFFTFIEKYKLVKIACSCLLSLGIFMHTIYYFYNDTSHGHLIYDEVSQISNRVVKESNGRIYTNEDLYNLYIRYESSKEGNEIIPDMAVINGIPAYSHILLVPGTSFPRSIKKEDYLLKEQNSYIEVYKLK